MIFVKKILKGYTLSAVRASAAPLAPLQNASTFGRLMYAVGFQSVAVIKHLFLCRYECQNFGFWGLFFGGAVLCIYYANEFSILPLFRFVSSKFVAYLFLLTRWLMCHVTTLSSCHIICSCGLKCRRRATLFALEDLKTYHVVKLFCGRRFATLFALCVSY